MASKEKFVEPMKKSYSVKQLLNGDSLQEALHGIRNIQTMLWETMPDEHYAQVERHFDVAIASMMAHLIGVPVEDPREDEHMEEGDGEGKPPPESGFDRQELPYDTFGDYSVFRKGGKEHGRDDTDG